jgi:hypothetical protein
MATFSVNDPTNNYHEPHREKFQGKHLALYHFLKREQKDHYNTKSEQDTFD